jgi:Flp pilus assembly protein TadD
MPRPITGRRVRRWLRARNDFSTLLGLSSRDRDVLAWQAYRHLSSGKIEEAEAIYRAMLTLWPALSSALLGLGACLQMKGDLIGAEAAYDEVLTAEPTNPHALANRAEVRLLLDHRVEAQADLDVAQGLPSRQLRRAGLVNRLETLRTIAMTSQ